MADNFPEGGKGLLDSALKAFTITPADDTDLAFVTRALHCNVAGDVNILFAGDTVPVIVAMNAGQTYPYRAKQIQETNTTATVVGLY